MSCLEDDLDLAGYSMGGLPPGDGSAAQDVLGTTTLPQLFATAAQQQRPCLPGSTSPSGDSTAAADVQQDRVPVGTAAKRLRCGCATVDTPVVE